MTVELLAVRPIRAKRLPQWQAISPNTVFRVTLVFVVPVPFRGEGGLQG
jgi:hypothetical protein